MRHTGGKFGGKAGFVVCLRECAALLLGLVVSGQAAAQVVQFPYAESFESTVIPELPDGWESSRFHNPAANDFVTASGTAHSGAVAIMTTNATVGQELYSPVFNFHGVVPSILSFFTRRSSSFRAGVVLEGSEDGGLTYPFLIGDTVHPTGSTSFVLSTMVLPGRIADSGKVRFRWRVVPDASGATGTFRLDDVTLSVRASRDLALSRIRISPITPIDGDIVESNVVVKNLGRSFHDSVEVRLFRDGDGDALAEVGEEVCVKTFMLEMGEGDSAELPLSLGRLSPGSSAVIGVLIANGDGCRANDTAFEPLVVGFRRGAMLVNEIMYAPNTPEPEWVELVNDGTDSVDMNEWQVSDAAVTARHTIARNRRVVEPGGYIILTKDSVTFSEIHPSAAKRVVSVPGFPSLNNGGDMVVLYDMTGRTIDSVSYVPGWGGNAGGVSLERRDPLDPANQASSWGSSSSDEGSTPGSRNSNYRKEYDLGIGGCRVVPGRAAAGKRVCVIATVRNMGRQSAVRGAVNIDESVGEPRGARIERIESSEMRKALGPGDSVLLSIPIPLRWSGEHRFTVTVAHSLDMEKANDTGTCLAVADVLPGAVKINEIMFDPPAGTPEWVELVNTGKVAVDLVGWKIGNRSAQSRYPVTDAPALLRPGDMAVMTKDSTALAGYYAIPGQIVRLPTMPVSLWSNSGDAVVLKEPGGLVSDSVWYRPAWGGGNGRSLERRDLSASSLDSTTWAPSSDASGATPGRRNTTALLMRDLLAASLRWESVAEGQSIVLYLTVVNDGKFTQGPFDVGWYEDVDGDSAVFEGGRIGSTVVTDSIPSHGSCTAVFRWEPSRGGSHRIVAVVEASGDERAWNDTARVVAYSRARLHALVVNEIMFDPGPGDCEYVELYNPSQEPVDYSGWTVMDRQAADVPGRKGVNLGGGIVKPGEYIVIAADSMVVRRFSPLHARSPRLLRVGGWSGITLNNDADDVILCDATGATIDSVSYKTAWHSARLAEVTGISLERRQAALGSCDGRNWTSSMDPLGGTPGARNSVWTPLSGAGGAFSCSPNPFSPDGDGVEDCCVVHYELPERAMQVNVRIFDVRGRVIRELNPQVPALPRGDLLWDGADDGGRRARIGVYILLLEGRDAAGGVIQVMREAVVLAGRLE